MLKKVITYFLIIFWLLSNSSFLYALDFDLVKIQSGLEKINSKIYQCKKKDCKVNLIVEGYTDKDYLCVWDFGGGTFKTKSTDKKCNPGYVDFKLGEYNINLKIYKDNDLENIFKQENFKIINGELNSNSNGKFYSDEVKVYSGETKLDYNYSDFLPKSIIGNINASDSKKENKDNQVIVIPKIIVQSGLDYLTGTTYKCKKKDCKINLTSSGFSDKNYNCLWSFSGGTFKTKNTDKKCNPGYVDYGTGEYEVGLKVINKLDSSKFFKSKIFIKNLEEIKESNQEISKVTIDYKKNGGGKSKDIVSGEIKIEKNINKKPKANITLQGVIAKYKKLSGNRLICEGVDKCSVNLTGENSEDEDKKTLKYFWDYGNGQKFEISNPKGVYFEKGKYKISLKVVDKNSLSDVAYFYVEVIPKNAILEESLDRNIFGNLKIYGVLPNTSGRDDREFIELENKSSYKLNLKGLIISDASKNYKIESNLYLYPYSKRRFYKNTTKLSLGNKKDLVKLTYNNVLLDELKWNFDIPDNFLLTHKNIHLDFEEVYVSRVIDGDTIKVRFDNDRFAIVRLLGIDTPETKDPRKEVQFYGIEAANFTKKSLENKKVYLEYDKSNLSGKYGRLLAYVYLDKKKIKNFNQILVENGYARVYLKYPFKYEKYFLKSQTKAKKQKLGIWQNTKIKKEALEEIKKEKINLDKQNLFNLDKLKLIGKEYKEIKKNFNKKIDKVLSYKITKIPKYIGISKWFNGKVVNTKISKNNPKKHKENLLKKSIKYRVSKNKKAFKITGYSYKFKNILINFQNKNFVLKTDKNNKFELSLLKPKSGEFYASFYGIDISGEKIFLKKSRKIVLSDEYVNSIGKIKKSGRKKKMKLANTLSTTKKYVSQEIKNKSDKLEYIFDFKGFILKILIGILTVLFLFLILVRKKLLQ